MIDDPVTIGRENTVGDALAMMQENKIGGIPVVDNNRYLVGIVTNRDLRFQKDMSRKIEEVMTSKNLVTITEGDKSTDVAEVLLSNKIEKLPVVDKEGHLVGLITYKDLTKAQDHPNACKDKKGRLRVAAGIGITPDAMAVDVIIAGEDESGTVLKFTLFEGRNRQIRKMCEAADLTVKRLSRVSIGNLKLDGLPTGKWRYLEQSEVDYLYKATKEVKNV